MDEIDKFIYISNMEQSEIESYPISSISGFQIQIQQCRHTILKRWDFPHGLAPFWRLYYFPEGKVEIRWLDKKNSEHLIQTNPDQFYIIPPGTVYSGSLSSLKARHLFIHFTLGPQLNTIAPGIYIPGKEKVVMAFLERITGDEYVFSERGAIAADLFILLSHSLQCIPAEDWTRPVGDSRIRRCIRHMEKTFPKIWMFQYWRNLAV